MRSSTAAALVASVSDYFHAIRVLLGSSAQWPVMSVLRSMQEALADIILLCEDVRYIDRLDLDESLGRLSRHSG